MSSAWPTFSLRGSDLEAHTAVHPIPDHSVTQVTLDTVPPVCERIARQSMHSFTACAVDAVGWELTPDSGVE